MQADSKRKFDKEFDIDQPHQPKNCPNSKQPSEFSQKIVGYKFEKRYFYSWQLGISWTKDWLGWPFQFCSDWKSWLLVRKFGAEQPFASYPPSSSSSKFTLLFSVCSKLHFVLSNLNFHSPPPPISPCFFLQATFLFLNLSFLKQTTFLWYNLNFHSHLPPSSCFFVWFKLLFIFPPATALIFPMQIWIIILLQAHSVFFSLDLSPIFASCKQAHKIIQLVQIKQTKTADVKSYFLTSTFTQCFQSLRSFLQTICRRRRYLSSQVKSIKNL